jgi:hypothetical protein
MKGGCPKSRRIAIAKETPSPVVTNAAALSLMPRRSATLQHSRSQAGTESGLSLELHEIAQRALDRRQTPVVEADDPTYSAKFSRP